MFSPQALHLPTFYAPSYLVPLGSEVNLNDNISDRRPIMLLGGSERLKPVEMVLYKLTYGNGANVKRFALLETAKCLSFGTSSLGLLERPRARLFPASIELRIQVGKNQGITQWRQRAEGASRFAKDGGRERHRYPLGVTHTRTCNNGEVIYTLY